MSELRPRKVLFLAYYFPPLGMGGVQRAAKLVKYLPQFGWEPMVVTVKEIAYFAKDTALAQEVEEARVYRSGSLDPQRLAALLRRAAGPAQVKTSSSGLGRLWKTYEALSKWLFVPDAKILWAPFALVRGAKLAAKERVRVVVTTSPPTSAHLVGLLLRSGLRCRWVADFRDQWTGGHLDLSPTVVHRALQRMLEKLVLKRADAVVCVSRALGASLSLKSSRRGLRLAVIPNGYDEEDFRHGPAPRWQRGRIVYCGSLSRLADPSNFLRACALLLAQRPQLRRQLRLVFVGSEIGHDFRSLAAELGLGELVEFTGYVAHRQAIQLLQSAEVLLLLLTGTTSRDVVPGKIFEYLRAGRPILAIIPPGETAELLHRYAPGAAIVENTVEAIARAIVEVLGRRRGEALVDVVGVRQFERRQLAADFARVLEMVSKDRESLPVKEEQTH